MAVTLTANNWLKGDPKPVINKDNPTVMVLVFDSPITKGHKNSSQQAIKFITPRAAIIGIERGNIILK